MLAHILKKEKAIALRKEGKTYSEILKEVAVAKSTLTEWFRGVGLTVPEFQRLTEKKLAAARRGGEAKRAQRIQRIKNINEEALKDIRHISKRELWLTGIVLYWAEGTKEKDFHPGSSISFNNSDPRMIKVFVIWLLNSCKVARERVAFEIYIHENSKNSVDEARNYWAQISGFPKDKFNQVYFKKNKIKKTNRRNTGALYYGLLRVKVRSSSSLVRRIAGWTEALVRQVK